MARTSRRVGGILCILVVALWVLGWSRTSTPQASPAASGDTPAASAQPATAKPAAVSLTPQQVAERRKAYQDLLTKMPVEDAILKRLQEPVELKFTEAPLEEVVQKLQAALGVPIVLDMPHLDEIGVTSETPVTISHPAVPADAALEAILSPYEATWLVHDHALVITSSDAAKAPERMSTRVYDVSDLLAASRPDIEALADLITVTVSPDDWADSGGQGMVATLELPGIRALVVAQSLALHRQVAELLAKLRGVRKTAASAASPSPPSQATPLTPAVLLEGSGPTEDNALHQPAPSTPSRKRPHPKKAPAKSAEVKGKISSDGEKAAPSAPDASKPGKPADDIFGTPPKKTNPEPKPAPAPNLFDEEPDAGFPEPGKGNAAPRSNPQCRGADDPAKPNATSPSSAEPRNDATDPRSTLKPPMPSAEAAARARQRYEESRARLGAEEAIRQILRQPIEVDFDELPLADAVGWFSGTLGVPLRLDLPRLDDVGLARETPLRLHIRDVPAESALRHLLNPYQATLVVDRETVLITSVDASLGRMALRVYDVSDLLNPQAPDFDRLCEAIQSTIERDSWDEAGGQGNVSPCSSTGICALVVRQSDAVQQKIARLLADLRALQSPERRKAADPGSQGAADGGREALRPSARQAGAFDEETPVKPYPVPPVDPRMGLAQWSAAAFCETRFACDLYQQIARREKGNILLAPLSVYRALVQVYAGAHGQTGAELASVLQATALKEDLPLAVQILIHGMNYDAARSGLPLNLSARLWMGRGFGVARDYPRQSRCEYAPAVLDFGDRDAAAAAVNDWLGHQASHRARQIVNPDHITLAAPGLLTCAAAARLDPFTSRPFSLPCYNLKAPFRWGRDEVTAPMINYAATAGGDADGLQLAEFDCAPGLSMIVLLPKDEPEEMERLEQSLTAEKLRDWLARMKPPIGPQSAWRVEIPELRLKQRLALGSHLRDMGMPSAFDAATADFRGITEKQGFCIKEVLADASLTIADAWRGSPVHGSIVPVVGKDGTVPIKDVLAQFTPAVTGAMVPSLFGGGVATLDPTPGFRLDRPFVFLIRDKRSGAIVFMGRVAEPLSVAAPPDRPAAAKHRAAQNVGRAARGPRSARPGGMGGVAPSHSGSGMGMM